MDPAHLIFAQALEQLILTHGVDHPGTKVADMVVTLLAAADSLAASTTSPEAMRAHMRSVLEQWWTRQN